MKKSRKQRKQERQDALLKGARAHARDLQRQYGLAQGTARTHELNFKRMQGRVAELEKELHLARTRTAIIKDPYSRTDAYLYATEYAFSQLAPDYELKHWGERYRKDLMARMAQALGRHILEAGLMPVKEEWDPRLLAMRFDMSVVVLSKVPVTPTAYRLPTPVSLD